MTPSPKHSRDSSSGSNSSSSSNNNNNKEEKKEMEIIVTPERPLKFYIPEYLRRYVLPYHDDFCYTPHFHPSIIVQLMMEGFLPIACNDFVLPKLHRQRCIICPLSNLHISKSIRKKLKKFTFTINTAFEQVITGCHKQHGDHCWLYPNLVTSFRKIHEATKNGSFYPAVLSTNNKKQQQQQSRTHCPIRLYSIEVWNENDELVAGELGYTVGTIFTSLTGFSSQDSAGSIQLVALGTLLSQCGFTVWDLGMEMEYKTALGATLMPRHEFVRIVHQVREINITLHLPYTNTNNDSNTTTTKMNCRDIIDSNNNNNKSTSSNTNGTNNYAAAAAMEAAVDNNTKKEKIVVQNKQKITKVTTTTASSSSSSGSTLSVIKSTLKQPRKKKAKPEL